jgi:ribonuclease BN (tRNA processing enzyme)
MKELFKVIGCRAGSPADGIPASGYVIEGPSGNVLIDCGPGVVLSLKKDEIDNLTGVVITHQHADHCLDLIALSYNLSFPTKKKKIPLYGPPSLLKTLEILDETFCIETLPTLKTPIFTAFEFIPVKPGDSFSVGAYTFDTVEMEHPVPTMAVRSRNYKLVYTSDGAYTDSLVEFCKGTSCLIAEATYPHLEGKDLKKHGHMTARLCAELAAASGVKELIITHLSDFNDSPLTSDIVKGYFSGNIEIAYPGLEIMLSEYLNLSS